MEGLTMTFEDTRTETKTQAESKTPSELTLLENMEMILKFSRKKGFDRSFYENAGIYAERVAQVLGITPIQAALFAHFLNKANDCYVNMETLADSLKCTRIQLIQYMDEFDVLEKKKLLCARRDEKSVLYRVPLEVINSLRKGGKYEPSPHVNLSIVEFFAVVETLFEQRSDNELTFRMFCDELKILFENNPDLEFVKYFSDAMFFDFEDTVLLLTFCHCYVNNDDDLVGFHDLDDIFENNAMQRRIIRSLREGTHILMETGLVENANSEGFGDRDFFHLSNRAKKELLAEINIREKNVTNKKDLIKPERLAVKKLFFNKKEAEKIGELRTLLQKDNFEQVQKRLEENTMRKGFACLFYGPPGTGKTETAYQIAKETGRDIMLVDIAGTKSMWFGESEKRIKDVFDRYRAYVELAEKNSELVPILLFNEADAVIGKRIEVTTSTVAQTENAMQNIILQEIENLSGILIATTNLTKNMDTAFERRFLYKIAFLKPDREARHNIWKSIIPALTDADAENLSAEFTFSGGQIENIARKWTVEHIIKGAKPTLDVLRRWCEDEFIARKAGGSIGFKNVVPSSDDYGNG
jgi:Cdc6-like AAA superfamily ATPase